MSKLVTPQEQIQAEQLVKNEIVNQIREVLEEQDWEDDYLYVCLVDNTKSSNKAEQQLEINMINHAEVVCVLIVKERDMRLNDVLDLLVLEQIAIKLEDHVEHYKIEQCNDYYQTTEFCNYSRIVKLDNEKFSPHRH